MVKLTRVEFSTIAYDMIKDAIIKTGDIDTARLFQEVVHMDSFGNTTFWYVSKDLLFGFIDEIYKKYKVINTDELNKILQNCHEKGYYRKTFRY